MKIVIWVTRQNITADVTKEGELHSQSVLERRWSILFFPLRITEFSWENWKSKSRLQLRHFFGQPLFGRTGCLGKCVGIEAQALWHRLRVTPGRTVGCQIYRETLHFAAVLKFFLWVADDRRDGCFHPADLVHAALGLEVPGRLHFQPFVLAGVDERAPPESMLEPNPEPGKTDRNSCVTIWHVPKGMFRAQIQLAFDKYYSLTGPGSRFLFCTLDPVFPPYTCRALLRCMLTTENTPAKVSLSHQITKSWIACLPMKHICTVPLGHKYLIHLSTILCKLLRFQQLIMTADILLCCHGLETCVKQFQWKCRLSGISAFSVSEGFLVSRQTSSRNNCLWPIICYLLFLSYA